jgi:fatty-acid peroxygenase
MELALADTRPIPREAAWDSTFALLSEGYEFMPRRFQRHASDIFEARLMARRVFCVMGEDASRMFFHPGRFTRRGAIPPNTLLLLQDRGSVQALDGAAHAARKATFMALAAPAQVASLVACFERRWDERLPSWRGRDLALHPEMEAILCRAACDWAGVPLHEHEADHRTREFAAMIDGAGSAGPRNWRGLAMRSRTERWAREVVRRARAQAIHVEPGTAFHRLLAHRDPGGRPLDDRVMAVELLNVLRPTVAIARFVTFAAHALHENPACREMLSAGDDACAERFVLEVRRRYPFFTALGGRALHSFEWRGHHFPRHAWVLFDIRGTLMDPRLWEAPERFDPGRFSRPAHATAYAPQGGGDPLTGHRCPGEAATLAVVRAAALRLARMRYEVPPQDLSIDLRRMPAIPASRFVIRA